MTGNKKIVMFGLGVGILILSLTLYRSCGSGRTLDVDPHARKEIEKATHQ
jgi:hypothetical protein